ncbi:TonB-linked outer membrane protein, SusC/RagA family [Pedobacter hartonius]|uniref:TonB-linked outer membrane protein, SusC/RagA family n=2 Tax=Pedobacter hartonius TaxID=425514 RepID=A0A1H4BNE2_9SPHI|nr:TonB-linked outer membrane protein, SusC/RagA family [Pedobacter hartonius]
MSGRRLPKKLLLTMKLTALILIIALTQLSAKSYSQKINLHQINISLSSALNAIESQTGYTFFAKNFNLDKPIISISLKNATLEEAIRKCLKNLPLTYSINGMDVTLIRTRPSHLTNAVNKAGGFFRDIDVHGRVLDENGLALQGTMVKIQNVERTAITDSYGEFEFISVDENSILTISHLGYVGVELKASAETGDIQLQTSVNQLHEVIISTGYQKIAREGTTGSFTLIDNKLVNRSVSPDFLSRLRGVTNGLLVDSQVGNTTGISVRGRSTLFSETKPLIVIDNFPFEGDLNTINPNDIEDVTVLKDAAAAAIWGVRAGNGVIVITTKKGKLNQQTKVSFNTNITIGNKPDLHYQRQMTSAEFTDLEKFLYSKGRYNTVLRNNYEVISPAIALLSKETSANTAATQASIDALKNNDARNQLEEYFYQKSIQQQYYLSLSGGGMNNTYHLSAGYDHLSPVTVGASNSRYTLKANNTYDLVDHKVQLTTDITFTRSLARNDNADGYAPLYPYEQIADQYGNALSVLTNSGLRTSYTDTAGNGSLLNWKYRPLEELRKKANSFKGESTDIRVNTGMRYQLFKPLAFSVNYQYFRSTGINQTLRTIDSYATRNAINEVTQINSNTGAVTNPMPIGDQFNRSNNSFNANYGRAQLDFRQTLSGKHNLNAIAGYEIRSENASSNSQKLYGYDPDTETSIIVDPVTAFPYYYRAQTTKLTNIPSSQRGAVDHYISYYVNAIYTYNSRLILSGSYRRDESNLFGVSAQKKGVPLFSTGIAWSLDKEKFYGLSWLPKLQMRATYGYNGNVNKTISAFTTVGPSPSLNYLGTSFSVIFNPPNPSLRWERVKNINFGLDFSLKNEVLSGSMEYYLKNGADLIGTSPIAQQTGMSIFTGNVADTHTRGYDIQLNSRNLNGLFKWGTTAIFNITKDKVTNYQVNTGSNYAIVSNSQSITPLTGYPILSIFSFRSLGLDSEGNPQGFVGKNLSTNYTSINNSTNRDELKYEGSAVPTVFGSLRNTFSFKSLELSVNISYKFGYYFRRAALQYSSLYSGDYHSDEYSERWQKPGDELRTTVPALVYPANVSRDHFYAYSQETTEKGDHIRLKDIQLMYTLSSNGLKKIGLGSVGFYTYANNLGILWRANKRHIDPDARSGYPAAKGISFGIKTNF